MSQFKFERHQINKIPREKVIQELEKVAEHYNYSDFKQDDFDKLADISAYKVYRELGSWDKVMLFLVDHYKAKGIDFKITTRRTSYSEQEIFNEMEKIWLQLGHRPSRDEWVQSNPEISYDTIYRRFRGWTNACHRFMEYKSGAKIDTTNNLQQEAKAKAKRSKPSTDENKKVIARSLSVNIRYKVLLRDKFRCNSCGKSPSANTGTMLHVDHIVPFSKGGGNDLDNLQTLCQDCNLGKSDLES